VQFPPTVKDVGEALKTLDVAYHMNHRKDGVPMFDASAGTMLEGIGHVGCRKLEANRAVMYLDDPYPCDFNMGLFSGLAERFNRRVKVRHDNPERCREHGHPGCAYTITW
jgi:hypothetical protein